MFDYLEGATPIDEDEKKGLLIPHISTWEELNEWERRNITDAYSWIDRTRRKDFLSEEFIRKLHEEPFSWGSGNLIEEGDVRATYIQALRSADAHDYQPLFEFVRN